MTDDRPSIFGLIQNCERIVAEDAACADLLRVAQEPWPTDGSLPRAAHLQVSEDTVEWTGEANGVTARCVVKGSAVVLYVKPSVDDTGHWVRLVDRDGVIYATTVRGLW